MAPLLRRCQPSAASGNGVTFTARDDTAAREKMTYGRPPDPLWHRNVVNALKGSHQGFPRSNLGKTPDGASQLYSAHSTHADTTSSTSQLRSHEGQGIDLSFDNKSWRGWFAIIVTVGFAYFLTARLGLILRAKPGNVAVFWPAAGVAIGALIALGAKARLPVAVAVAIATIASKLIITGDHLARSHVRHCLRRPDGARTVAPRVLVWPRIQTG